MIGFLQVWSDLHFPAAMCVFWWLLFRTLIFAYDSAYLWLIEWMDSYPCIYLYLAEVGKLSLKLFSFVGFRQKFDGSPPFFVNLLVRTWMPYYYFVHLYYYLSAIVAAFFSSKIFVTMLHWQRFGHCLGKFSSITGYH